MTALAVAGCTVAAALVLVVAALRRRLELVARAEHELRGPVTALSLAAEAMRRGAGDAPAEPMRRGAGDARAAALEGQVDRLRIALADLAAARRGRRAPGTPGPVALERSLAAAAAGWRAVARRAGGDVTLDLRARGTTVHADRGRLAQALGNVLANAVEHGGGQVRVSLAPAPGGVRVEVRDAGPRAATAVGARTPRRRRRAGRGRGLAIAGRAVRDAGGGLTLVPAGPGTRVAIDLPVAGGSEDGPRDGAGEDREQPPRADGPRDGAGERRQPPPRAQGPPEDDGGDHGEPPRAA